MINADFQKSNMASLPIDARKVEDEMIGWLVDDLILLVSNYTASEPYNELVSDLTLLTGNPAVLHDYYRAFVEGGRAACRRKYKQERMNGNSTNSHHEDD